MEQHTNLRRYLLKWLTTTSRNDILSQNIKLEPYNELNHLIIIPKINGSTYMRNIAFISHGRSEIRFILDWGL